MDSFGAYQIQKLTSGYENLGKTLARLGATYSILKSSTVSCQGSCITSDNGVDGVDVPARLLLLLRGNRFKLTWS